MQTNTTSVTTDTALSLLADRQRRALVEYLQTRGNEPVPVDELLEALTPSVRREQPTNVEIRLQHSHLPKLADAGVIEYEPDAGLVRYCESPTLESLLAFVTEELE